MARPKSRKPAYCLHKPSGRALVVLDGKFIYLGTYGTPESRDEYDRVVGEWIARRRQSEPEANVAASGAAAGVTVAEVAAAFLRHAKTYYVGRDGKPGGELENFRALLRWLNKMYGATPATEFGPKSLKAIREMAIRPHPIRQWRVEVGADGTRRRVLKEVVHPGWCRKYANRQTKRIAQVFKWATAEELIEPSVYQALSTVDALKVGKTEARESKTVMPAKAERSTSSSPTSVTAQFTASGGRCWSISTPT